MDMFELYGKPASYKFSDSEIKFIKKHLPKNNFMAKYAIYKPHSSRGCYIGFFIDQMPNSPRRSGIENHWEFICERSLTNVEYHEVIQNFGTNHRRFKVYEYKVIEALVIEDKKYNVDTPEKFVKICKEKGYTGDLQLKMDLYIDIN